MKDCRKLKYIYYTSANLNSKIFLICKCYIFLESFDVLGIFLFIDLVIFPPQAMERTWRMWNLVWWTGSKIQRLKPTSPIYSRGKSRKRDMHAPTVLYYHDWMVNANCVQYLTWHALCSAEFLREITSLVPNECEYSFT